MRISELVYRGALDGPAFGAPPMVYLLEGADGTGKTSYAERRVLGLIAAGHPEPRVIHNGPEDAGLPGSLFDHYRAQLLEALDFRDAGVTTFLDRSYLSELVYGQVYRARSRVSERQARRLDRLAQRAGVVTLGVVAATDVRRRRLWERGETFDLRQHLVADGYARHFQGPDSPWLIADSTSALVTL